MLYVINKSKQIICVDSKQLVENKTDELPVKIYDNVVLMTDRKLYWINLYGIVAHFTLIKIETYCLDPNVIIFKPCYDDEYIVQHFYDRFVIVNDKLFILCINIDSLQYIYIIKSLNVDNIHNLDNVNFFDCCILFVNDDHNLMLKKNDKVFLLDENIRCIKLWTHCYDYRQSAFFVTLYYNHKIIIRNYKKTTANDGYCIICEHEIQLDFCIKEVYLRNLIDTCGQVYHNNFNISSRECPFHNHCKTNNKMKQHEIDALIKEIFFDEDYYYLSYDGRIINSYGFTIANNILGSCVPKTNTKSANF